MKQTPFSPELQQANTPHCRLMLFTICQTRSQTVTTYLYPLTKTLRHLLPTDCHLLQIKIRIPASHLSVLTLQYSVGVRSQSPSHSLPESRARGAATAAPDPNTLLPGCAERAGEAPTSSWWETPQFPETNWFSREMGASEPG